MTPTPRKNAFSSIIHLEKVMDAYVVTHEQLDSWLLSLAENKLIYFPLKTGENNFTFEAINSGTLLDYQHYRPSILPPVKKLFPDGEILFTYKKDNNGHYHFSTNPVPAKQILAGVRACDLKAIYLMDQVLTDGIADTPYLQRRQTTTIIAFNCLTPCDHHCFCEATQSLDFQTGADVFITATEQQWLIEVLTQAGKELVSNSDWVSCQNSEEIKSLSVAQRPVPFGRQFNQTLENIPAIMQNNSADRVFEEYAQKCFSCGTCNLVCPTCYCFETRDSFNLDGLSGEKTRHWDACLNPAFAEVAGGHNFRQLAADRQRHRVRRKFSYLTKHYASAFCTGCGRCGRQCTTGIDIFDIVNDVVALATENP